MSWKVWLPAGAVGLVGFTIIQELRVTSGRLTSFDIWEDNYPSLFQPLLPLLARFDLFFAATDGVSAGAGSWLSVEEWAGQLLTGALPQLIRLADMDYFFTQKLSW